MTLKNAIQVFEAERINEDPKDPKVVASDEILSIDIF